MAGWTGLAAIVIFYAIVGALNAQVDANFFVLLVIAGAIAYLVAE